MAGFSTIKAGERQYAKARLPSYVVAVLAALNLHDPRPECLRALKDQEWNELLSFCDLAHLTLTFREACRLYMPEWARSRVDRNASDNAIKFEKIKSEYLIIAGSLSRAGAEHIVLKGFAQWSGCGQDPRFRMQSDVDLFCPSPSIPNALGALRELGFEADSRSVHFPSSQHLPTMVRKTEFEWKGNYFDPAIPLFIDLHFRLWNRESEGFAPDGLEHFWTRRTVARIDNVEFPALSLVDSLGYASLHVLRHILFSSLLVNHVYELAWFLHKNAKDTTLWKTWREWHGDSLRRLEAISFCLASRWFDGDMAPEITEEIALLPENVQRWLREYAFSPLEVSFQPNKNALWLHLCLVGSANKRKSVVRERLFGSRMPPLAAFENSKQHEPLGTEGRESLRARVRQLAYVTNRAGYHVRMLPAALWHGLGWWWSAGTAK
jgi:hypothetical protein